jgi:hypothetical protein
LTTRFTFNLTLEAWSFPRLFASFDWGVKELRWDVSHYLIYRLLFAADRHRYSNPTGPNRTGSILRITRSDSSDPPHNTPAIRASPSRWLMRSLPIKLVPRPLDFSRVMDFIVASRASFGGLERLSMGARLLLGITRKFLVQSLHERRCHVSCMQD